MLPTCTMHPLHIRCTCCPPLHETPRSRRRRPRAHAIPEPISPYGATTRRAPVRAFAWERGYEVGSGLGWRLETREQSGQNMQLSHHVVQRTCPEASGRPTLIVVLLIKPLNNHQLDPPFYCLRPPYNPLQPPGPILPPFRPRLRVLPIGRPESFSSHRLIVGESGPSVAFPRLNFSYNPSLQLRDGEESGEEKLCSP